MATLDVVAPEAAAEVRAWGVLLRGLVCERGALTLTAKFRDHGGELVRVIYDRSAGCSLRVGERSLTLPDEWLDHVATTDGRGDPS